MIFFPKPKYLVVYCRGSEVESRLAHDQCALKCCDMKNDRGEHHCHRHYTMSIAQTMLMLHCFIQLHANCLAKKIFYVLSHQRTIVPQFTGLLGVAEKSTINNGHGKWRHTFTILLCKVNYYIWGRNRLR